MSDRELPEANLKSNVTIDVANAWKAMVADCGQRATMAEPRGIRCYERTFQSFVIQNYPLRFQAIKNDERALNPLFMIAELLWILRGRSDVEFLARYVKKMRDFSDDGKRLNGAYGTRLRSWGPTGHDQLEWALEKLQEDPFTRQCVLEIFNPTLDHRSSKDIPCNTQLQFLRRGQSLSLHVTVRSQDVMLGFVYDSFHWMYLLNLMSAMLGIHPEMISYSIGSLHLYERDVDWAQRCIMADTKALSFPFVRIPDGIETFEDLDAKLLIPMEQAVEQIHEDFNEFSATSYDEFREIFSQDVEDIAAGLPTDWLQLFVFPFLLPAIYHVSETNPEDAKKIFSQIPIDIALTSLYVSWRKKFR